MPDDLSPFFESRETRLNRLPQDIRQGFESVGADSAELDRQFSSLWLSRRMGVPRADVLANFEGITSQLFGPETTPAAVWDRIAAEYAPPQAASGAQDGPSRASEGSGDTEMALGSETLPKSPQKGWLANTRDALGSGFQKVGLSAAAGFYSQLATMADAPRLRDPMGNDEYRRLYLANESLRNPGQFTQVYDEPMSFGPVLGPEEEKVIAANEARMAEIRATMEAENAQEIRAWVDRGERMLSADFRAKADFWQSLVKETDRRWETDPAFQQSTIGQLLQSTGGAPAYAALALLGPVGLVGVESSMFAGEEEQRREAEGAGYDPQAALPALAASASGQAVIEKALGIERALNAALGATAKVAGRVRFGDYARNFAKASLVNGIQEGVTEPAQGLLSDYIASLTYDESRELITGEGAKRRLVEAAGGFFVGSLFGGGVKTLSDVDQNMAASREGSRMLTAHDGQPLTPEEFRALRPLKTDNELAAYAGDEDAARLLIAAANGDQQAMVDYNTRVREAEFIDTEDAVADGMQMGDVMGVPVVRLEDGTIEALDLSDPETRTFIEQWQAAAVRNEQAAAEEETAEAQGQLFEQLDTAEGYQVEPLGKKFLVMEGVGEAVEQFQVRSPGEKGRGRTLTREQMEAEGIPIPTVAGQEARERFPEAYTPERMEGVSDKQMPIIIREADGREVPGLFNGYYGPGMVSVARWVENVGWSHGIIMEGRGATVVGELPPITPEFQQLGESNKQTETPEFKRWFGDSKVVDSQGNPLVVYHGTNSEDNFSQFDKFTRGRSGTAAARKAFFFTSSPENAENFAGTGNRARIVPAFLSLKNPLISDHARHSQSDMLRRGHDIRRDTIQRAIREGRDGVVFKNTFDFSGERTTVYAVFEPTQIKSAIGNRGTFDPNNPNITQQFGDRIQTGQNPQAPSQRVNVPAELRRIQRKLDKGKPVDVDVARLLTRMQRRAMRQADARAVDRTRGPDWLRERLLRARRNEELSEEHVEFALWLINQNPALVDEVAISLRVSPETGTAAGTYSPVSSLITIFTDRAKDNTAVHEILHHAERLMPEDVQKAIAREWSRAVDKALQESKGNPKRLEALMALMRYGTGAADSSTASQYFKDGTLKPEEYALANPSEFWAVHGTTLLKRRQTREASWLGKAREWLSGFIQRVRALFGLSSDSPVLKGLQGVLDGTYQGTPEAGAKMLSEASRFLDPATDPQDVGPPATELQARLERIRAKRLAARGDLLERIRTGETIPKRVTRTSRQTDVSVAAYLAQPIASRLAAFNPVLGARIREMELSLRRAIATDLATASAYFKKAKKLNDADGALLDQALRNGDREMIDALNARYGMGAEYAATVAAFAAIRQRLVETGMEVGTIENFWPRHVLDLDGLMAHYYGTPAQGVIDQALAQASEKAGRPLTDQERETVVNSALRGYRPRMDRRPSNTKERTTEVVDVEAGKYYQEFSAAAVRYIERMNEAIEMRRFFGTHLKTTTAVEGEPPSVDLPASIGSFVEDMVQRGQLDAGGQTNVRKALEARFAYQQTGGFIATMRSLGHFAALGQITSTMTQLGDWQFSLYESGFWDTLMGTAQALTRQSKVTREMLGLDTIGEEYRDPRIMARVVNLTFKLTGMHYVVTTGQQSLINGAIRRMSREARTGRLSPRTKARLAAIFPDADSYAQAMIDLQAGATTDSTVLLAWNVLSDWNPVSLSEMPAGYLNHPKGRIFYSLKTFDMKRFDAYRRESWDLIAKGNAAQKVLGFKRQLQLAALFLVAGASVDWLKAWVIGRETTLSDEVWNNLWKLFALNSYSMARYHSKDDSVAERVAKSVTAFPEALANWLLPPLSWFTTPAKDVATIADKLDKGEAMGWDDLESIRLIPLFGSTLYYRTGKGEKRQRSRRRGRSRSRSSLSY